MRWITLGLLGCALGTGDEKPAPTWDGGTSTVDSGVPTTPVDTGTPGTTPTGWSNPLLDDVPFDCWAAATLQPYGEGPRDLSLRAYAPDTHALLFDGLDLGDDGTWDYVQDFDYDDAGLLLVAAYDLDGDGVSELRIEYTWEEGRWTGLLFDWSLDGFPDSAWRVEYGPDGLTSDHWIDDGVDGEDDEHCTFTWFEAGRLDRELCDAGLDGTIDRSTTATWSPDGRESTTTSWLGSPEEGEVSRVDHIVRDAEGRQVLRELDEDGDGIWDRIETTNHLPDREEYRREDRALGELLTETETVTTLDGWRPLEVTGVRREVGVDDHRWTETWDWTCP